MTREPYEDTILRTIHGTTKKAGTKLQAIPHPEQKSHNRASQCNVQAKFMPGFCDGTRLATGVVGGQGCEVP